MIYVNENKTTQDKVNLSYQPVKTILLTSEPDIARPFYCCTWIGFKEYQIKFIEEHNLGHYVEFGIPRSIDEFDSWLLFFRFILVNEKIENVVYCLAELENMLFNEKTLLDAIGTKSIRLFNERDYYEYVKEDISDNKVIWLKYLHNVHLNSREKTVQKNMDCLYKQQNILYNYMDHADLPMSRVYFIAINESSTWKELFQQLKIHCEFNFVERIVLDAEEANKNKQFIKSLKEYFSRYAIDVLLVSEDLSEEYINKRIDLNLLDEVEELPFN